MDVPDQFFKSLETVFRAKNTLMRIRLRDPESFGPWIRDRGWKNSDPG
jgi:hypothetical protein